MLKNDILKINQLKNEHKKQSESIHQTHDLGHETEITSLKKKTT